ncbi:MAG: hypothetical protein UU77_C0053G0009 [candidate division WWE3 bacterium GW2011_GWC1_41_7]|uniref:Uncharacterized protein n=1 Tax=candidate division WWE3 bacterium GW2011_GWC1_41_7 TaxID=1619119 RepID=A0A0G0X2N7_UNCKA|nr:MAG: hypothetical protein UU77_C0053G0009 [candidate division WWE3 bacterium GW2011_GWC1_41_7]
MGTFLEKSHFRKLFWESLENIVKLRDPAEDKRVALHIRNKCTATLVFFSLRFLTEQIPTR